MATSVSIGRYFCCLVFLANFSASTSLDLAIILSLSSWEMHKSAEAEAGYLVPQGPSKNYMGRGPFAVLMRCVAVLEDRLHEVVAAASP